MNAASPSFVERIAWTPVTILLVVTLWRAARLDAAGAILSAAPLSRQS